MASCGAGGSRLLLQYQLAVSRHAPAGIPIPAGINGPYCKHTSCLGHSCQLPGSTHCEHTIVRRTMTHHGPGYLEPLTLGLHECLCCCLLVTSQLPQCCHHIELQVSCCLRPTALLQQLRQWLALRA